MGHIRIVDEKERFDFRFGESVIFYRRISQDHLNEIVERHTRKRFRRNQPTEEVDNKAVQTEALDFAILGWEGVHGRNGPIECTPENKRLLPVPVIDQLQDLVVGEGPAQGEESDKNLGNTSTSGGTSPG